MRNLLLLPPLLLGAGAAFPCEPIQQDGSRQTAQTLDEETRAVTLDITGMT